MIINDNLRKEMPLEAIWKPISTRWMNVQAESVLCFLVHPLPLISSRQQIRREPGRGRNEGTGRERRDSSQQEYGQILKFFHTLERNILSFWLKVRQQSSSREYVSITSRLNSDQLFSLSKQLSHSGVFPTLSRP